MTDGMQNEIHITAQQLEKSFSKLESYAYKTSQNLEYRLNKLESYREVNKDDTYI